MTTLLVTHPAFAAHRTPRGHPERPERMRAVDGALADPLFASLPRAEAPEAPDEAVALCHPPAYVASIRAASPAGDDLVPLDADTVLSAGSLEAALRAVGGAMLAVDRVMEGLADTAFLAARPPGHHAEPFRAMGFCLFNQAAIAARHAQRAHGVERVAIVDFDVHHGNGTQAIFWSDPSVLYTSTHEMPLYPGTGAASETGEHGTILNAPLRAGDGGPAFRAAMTGAVLPRLDAFAPDLVVVSAGFDAHRRDPLASLNLDAEDFAWVTERLIEVAARHARGRLVSVLEGGYDLVGLAASVRAHVATLAGLAR